MSKKVYVITTMTTVNHAAEGRIESSFVTNTYICGSYSEAIGIGYENGQEMTNNSPNATIKVGAFPLDLDNLVSLLRQANEVGEK